MKKFIVAQIGARLHYAVPRILYAENLLERFYTDIFIDKNLVQYLNVLPRFLKPRPVQRLIGRTVEDIPSYKISTFPLFGLEYIRRLWQSRYKNEIIKTYIWGAKLFNKKVIQSCVNNQYNDYCIYTVSGAGLELLEAANLKNRKSIIEQVIAPYIFEKMILEEEKQLHPEWEKIYKNSEFSSITKEFIKREIKSWNLSNLIICGSDFVRSQIINYANSDIIAQKCIVIPYGFNNTYGINITEKSRKKSQLEKLRVLTVGTIGLRKGIPYILEAAKQLQDIAIFYLVGPIQIKNEIVNDLKNYVQLIGQVPRNQVYQYFTNADVFLLPSLCEGSATSVYEALSFGLPVICTPNTGSIIRHEIDGFVIPIRDATAIADCLEKLSSSPELLKFMSENAYQRSQEFTLSRYSQCLIDTLTQEL